jgi:succinyl-diaminopimelate desuccinylase
MQERAEKKFSDNYAKFLIFLKGGTTMTPEQEKQYYAQMEQNFPEFLKAMEKLVSIPSYLEEDTYPDVPSLQEVLKATLAMMHDMGYRTYADPEGYYGYAEIGEGDTLIGVLGHLDVVPPGLSSDWHSEPFKVDYRDGKAYGRGVQDDKGPTLSAVYAMKALLDAGFKPNYRLRFIFGTDEENLWRGIKKYMEKEEKPNFGFTPDSVFPLIYAEKGVLDLILHAKNESGLVFKGGDAYNVVPSYVKAPYSEALKTALEHLHYEYRSEADGSIGILGKSIHAKDAELGVNAIHHYLLALDAMGHPTKAGAFVKDCLEGHKFAEPIFGEVKDEASGELKFNIGKIELTPEEETLYIDMRIPVTYPKEKAVEALKKKAAEYGFTYEEFDWLKPVYMPLDSPIITKLVASYREATGDTKNQPISSGGATYARAMDNCVAFGCILPGVEKSEHMPNEHMVVDEFKTAMKIYIHTFYNFNA